MEYFSADREKTVLHRLTALGAAGTVRPETMQAFDAKKFGALTAQGVSIERTIY